MGDKADKESNIISGVLFMVICLLLLWWRGPGFIEDINLFTSGERVTATIEKKIGARQRRGERAAFYFYFVAEGDTIRNESRMFEPLMAFASRSTQTGEQFFKVIHDTTNANINYPRTTLRIHLFVSLIIQLIGLWFGVLGIKSFKGEV